MTTFSKSVAFIVPWFYNIDAKNCRIGANNKLYITHYQMVLGGIKNVYLYCFSTLRYLLFGQNIYFFSVLTS